MTSDSDGRMRNRSNGSILIIDDDGNSRKMLARVLADAGYRCAESDSGASALAAIRDKPPSLLLLDFEMPDLDGTQVLKQLRSDPDPAIAQIPTIMLTGHAGEESEVLCLEAGADDFVTKPINTATLRARIETQLRLRSMRRQLERQNDELEAWRRTLERDLESARLTQQSLIPQKPPSLHGWEIASCYRPVIQVGGDIYGWVAMRDGRVLFWIADATGHGASAALLTTLAKLLFHHGAIEKQTPVGIMKAVDDDFRTIFGARSFMTAMCVVLDPQTGRASVLGAGHPPLLIARRKGKIESVPSSTPPLGLTEKTPFVETFIELAVGDTFLLYTDGLFGAPKDGQPRLNPTQLGKLLDSSAPTAEVVLARLLSQITPDHGEKTLPDDLAALAVRRTA